VLRNTERRRQRETAIVAAVLLISLLLSACTGSGRSNSGVSADHEDGAASSAIVELKAITMGTEPAAGMDVFYQRLDELTVRDLGVRVRFDFVPWGDEKDRIGRAIVSKGYDLYVGGVWSDFTSFAAKNAFADLAPLLAEVPELVEHYRGQLEKTMAGGKLYGIPQLIAPGGGAEGMLYREDLRKQWKLPAIVDFASAEQYIYRAQEAYPDTPMISDKRFAANLWTLLAGSKYLVLDNGYAVAPVDDPYRAISKYDTPEYRQVLTHARQWYEDGIVDPDILAARGNATSETLELMLADKKPLEFNNHFGAVSSSYIGVLNQEYPAYEYGWFDYFLGNVPSYRTYPAPDKVTMISVGAHSKHVGKALRLIAKAHTEREYYDLLMYGVDGVHYMLDDDNRIHYDGIPAQNRKPGWTGLVDGYMNLDARYPIEWQAIHDRLQQEGVRLAERGGESPHAGFVFDTSSLAGTLKQLDTMKSQVVLPLEVGMMADIDAELVAARMQLREAGLDAYLEALQRQLDAFAASRP